MSGDEAMGELRRVTASGQPFAIVIWQREYECDDRVVAPLSTHARSLPQASIHGSLITRPRRRAAAG